MSDTFEEPTSVAFHFDVMCPYAFQTSLWMRDVRDQLGLQVDWRFFSLEEVNREEGKKHPWEREWSYGWSMMRIGALLRRTDMALLDQWYLAAGTALHVEGRKPHRPEVAEELLAGMGLDPGLVARAIADPTTGDEVLAEHEQVLALVGLRRADPRVRRHTAGPPGAVRSGADRSAHRRRRRRACGTPSRPGSGSRTCTSCSARSRRPTSRRSARRSPPT